MKIDGFNKEVNLLEIANRGKINQTVSDKKNVETFRETFSQQIAKSENISFSKHARERLFSRGIALSNEKLSQLSEALDRASDKGSKNTLILDTEAAYVASIPNRTIITAFSRANLQEGVFTSIDSAVIL